MSRLAKQLPSEVIAELASIVHQGVCDKGDEEMDEDDAEECVGQDLDVVGDLLDVLERAGCVVSIWIPIRNLWETRDNGALKT